jgi:hypothetical protein
LGFELRIQDRNWNRGLRLIIWIEVGIEDKEGSELRTEVVRFRAGFRIKDGKQIDIEERKQGRGSRFKLEIEIEDQDQDRV